MASPNADYVGHPTDVALVEMAEHLRVCEQCRRGFARIMYEPEPSPNGRTKP